MGSKSSQRSSSASTSSSIGIGQDLNGNMVDGNNNTINQTDHGALASAMNLGGQSFSTVNNANDNLSQVVDATLTNNASLTGSSFALADSITSQGVSLASEGLSLADSITGQGLEMGYELGKVGINAGMYLGDVSAGMLEQTLSTNENMFSAGLALADNSNARTLDSALMVHETGLSQIEQGNNLALSLAELNGGQMSETSNALTNGFKSSMQFVEQFSRSDGNALAQTNLKTVGVLAVAGVALVFISKKIK
jgi:hypothetical protein